MAEAEEVIRFEHVTKAFEEVPVLNDLSFAVRRGETLCVVGPSGTGKSVTLKHIVRLVEPDAGRVLVGGRDLSGLNARELSGVRSHIGYLFQSGALLAWLTVAENVALPLRENRLGLSEAEIEARVAEALRAVELAAAADKYPSEISGGMQKRAGLARVLVRDADILLYDEPTSGLDPVTSVRIHGLIRRLARARGLTSIVVTHDLLGALHLADRLMLLKAGRVEMIGTPDEFRTSAQPDVRAFLAATMGELRGEESNGQA